MSVPTAQAGPPLQQLALGTVQFGLDYGITNAAGRVCDSEVPHLLDTAWAGGLRTLDTAAAYGDSERSLGRSLAARPDHQWRIVTKTLPLRLPHVGAEQVEAVAAAFDRSLEHLGVPAVDTLLVHHANDLLVSGGDALFEFLRRQQAAGRTARIGVSIYDAAEAVQLMDRYAFEVVQLPASIADQRLLRDGTVQRLADAGIEIHVRSLYLQGLLLAEPGFVANRFPQNAAWAQQLRDECLARALSPLQACLSFFRSQPGFDVAVLGMRSQAEVRALLAAWSASAPMDWSGWAVDNAAFTDPRQWKTT